MRIGKALNKAVTLLAIWSLILPPALAQEIVGAGSNAPQVLTSANGTPLIMIQAPNASGVSHNTYAQFDVGTAGVILNNASSNYTLTNMGGYVQGNANLAGGSARLIINEVTSANPSELLGYIEVAGAAADVVIANPWGITCNGCGFINTPRAVFTTGTPVFAGTELKGFSVESGAIAIGELGLDARGVSQFDLIARKVTFGGSVHGQRVRVIAGRNDVIFATGEATAKAADGSAPEYAIDSSVLGGMYAGSIALISTEAGAGVRAPARMSANAGDMVITADGRLVLGEAATSGRLTARGTDVTVQKSLSAKNSLSISALRDLVLEADGTIVTEAAANLSAGRDLVMGQASTVYSEVAAFLTSPGRFSAGPGARVLSFGDISLSAGTASFGPGSLYYAGLAPQGGTARVATLSFSVADTATASSATFFATGQAVFDAGTITIDADAGLDPSRFVSLGEARLTADRFHLGRAVIETGGNLTMEASQEFSAAAGTRVFTARALRLSAAEMALAGGFIAAAETARFEAQTFTQGAVNTLAAGGALEVHSDSAALQGKVQGKGVTLAIVQDANLSGEIQSTAGLTVLGRNLVVSGTNLANASVRLTASGDMALSGRSVAGGDLVANAAGVLANSASLGANGQLQLTGAGLVQSGDLVGLGGISLSSGQALSATGTLKSGGDLLLTAGSTLTSSAGLLSGGTIRLAATGALVNSGSGLAASGADALALSMSGASVTNSGRFEILATATLSAASGGITNSASLTAGGDLRLQAAGALENAGALVSLAALSLTSGSDLSNTGVLRAGADLTLTSAANLTNSANLIAPGDLRLIASGDLINSGGFLTNGHFALTAGAQMTQSGNGLSATTASASAMTLTAAGIVQSGSARVSGPVSLTALQGDLTNRGSLISNGAMTLAAAGNLQNEAALITGGNLALTGGAVTATAALTAIGTLSASAEAGDLRLSADTASVGQQVLAASNAMVLSANHRSVDGVLSLTAGSADVSGTLLARGISADVAGALQITGDLASQTSLTLNAGSFDLRESGSLASLGAMQVMTTTGPVTLEGDLTTNAGLALTSALDITQGAASGIIALSGTRLTAADQVSLAGTLAGNGTISLTTPSAVILATSAQLLSTQGNIEIVGGAKPVAGGVLGAELSGSLIAGQNISVSASRIGQFGQLTAGALTSLTSTSGGLDLGGEMSSGGLRLKSAEAITVSGHLRGAVQAEAVGSFVNSGQIEAGLFILNAASFTDGTTAKLNVDGDAVLTLSGDATIHGAITTSGVLAITSGGRLASDGLVDAGKDLVLVGVTLDNRGKLEGQSIAARFADIINAGTIHSLDDATLLASAGMLNTGVIKARDDLTLSAERLVNQAQIAAEEGILSLRGRALLDNNLGRISAGEGLVLATNQDLALWSATGGSAIGNFESGGWLAIQGADGGAAGTLTLKAGESLVAAGDLVVHAAGIVNAGTIASASGNLILRSTSGQTNTGLLYAGGDWLMLRAGGDILNDAGVIMAAKDMAICGNTSANCLADLSADRAASLTNKNGGRIETLTGDMILAASNILNEREVTTTLSDPVVSSGNQLTHHECYFAFFGCWRGANWYTTERTTVVERSFSLSTDQASLVSGQSIIIDAGTITNDFGLISAVGDLSIRAGSLANSGTTSGSDILFERLYMLDEWGVGWGRTTLLSAEDPVFTATLTGAAFGTIEAGGTISGTITGTVTNQSVNANALTLTSVHGTAPVVSAAAVTDLAVATDGFAGILAPEQVDPTTLAVSNPAGPAPVANATLGGPVLTPAPTSIAELAFTDGPGQNVPAAQTAPGGSTITPGSVTTGINLAALGNDQLFVIAGPDATGPLIETRHQFIDLSAFISSDYFLASLNFDPEITQRRLGDALVETWLVRDQLTRLTGGRILEPGLSEREQMRAMYDNAIDAARSLDLRPGIALTPAQIASLSENIIWMEERVVSGQRVLVPQVYLAAASQTQGPATGARISGTTIAMNVGNLDNIGGTIEAGDALVIRAAGDITNRFGMLAGGTGDAASGGALSGALSLSALNGTFTNLSGIVTAATVAISALDATIATDKLSFGSGANLTEIAGAAAGIIARDDLFLSIVQDVTLTGANLQAGQNLTLLAGNDIKLDALDLTHRGQFQSGNSLNEFDQRLALTSSLSALSGNLTVLSAEFSQTGRLVGGGDISSEGAALIAGGSLSVTAAAGHVMLGAAQESSYSFHFDQGGGWLSSYSNRAESFDLTHVETALNGAEVTVFAAGGLVSSGGDLASTTGDLSLTGGQVMLLAATDIRAAYRHSSSSVLGGLFDYSSTVQDLRSLAVSANVVSAEDLFIDSATTLTLQGSELEAARDISVKASEATSLIATVDTTANSTVTHNNNGLLVTDTTSVTISQTAGFPGMTAGGTVSFDPGSMATVSLDEYQSSLGVSALSLIAIGEAGDLSARLAIMEATLGIKRPETDKPDTGTSPPNPAYDFAASKVDLGRPTATEFAYLDTLFAQGKLTVEDMAIVQHDFFKQDTQLGVLGQLLVTYLTGQITSGIAGFTAMPGWQQAAIKSLVSGGLEGAATGRFDIGKLLQNAAFAGVSSFATSDFNLNEHLGLGSDNLLGLDKGSLSLAGIADQFGDAVISAGLTTAVHGGDFGANLLSSFRSGVLNMAMADLQQIIGDRYNDANGNPKNGGEGSFGHVSEHTLLGCLMGEALGGTCATGALAGMGQALYAGYLEANPTNLSDQAVNANAELIAGLFAALGSGGNVNATMIASGIGLSGFQNNFLFHEEALEREQTKKALKDCEASKACSEDELSRLYARIAALDKLDQERDAALRTACTANPQGSECLRRVEELAYAVQWFYDRPDPVGLGDSLSRSLQLDYLNAAWMQKQGMDPYGVAGSMVTEWEQSIALLNEFRPSYETVATNRFNNLALTYGTELALSLMGGAVSRLPGDAIKVTSPADILKIPKGMRPDPSTYMTKAEIEAHLKLFEEGAIRITPTKNIEQYGNAGPNGGFVLPKSELRRIMQETGGDIALIEKKLGLNAGDLASGKVTILEIAPQNMANLRIPSGNEGGVNENWVPGGYTSGGVPEAVMDLSRLSADQYKILDIAP